MTSPENLPDVPLINECSYVAAFLTMACPYRCSYCINQFGGARRREGILRKQQWLAALNRLTNLNRQDSQIPITLQGGEPTIHPDFYDLVNELDPRIRLDLLTNLSFDVEEMIDRVDPERLKRDAPYASIRVSYHPSQVELDELLKKTLRLQRAGFHIGVWGVLHPEQEQIIRQAQQKAIDLGIDFRTKPFLGYYRNQLYGQYRYARACSMEKRETVSCRTSELIIGPNGNVYRCHHDLYDNRPAIGNLLDRDFQMNYEFRSCDDYGHCNPCDIKVKTNRLQQFGHTAVTIESTDESKATSNPQNKLLSTK